MPPLPALTGMTRDDLVAKLEDWGEATYRADQILSWIFEKRVKSIDAMSNLSRPLREKLAAEFQVRSLEPVRDVDSSDTTRKYLYRLHDGRFVESVLIPASPALYGESSDRHTICVSSQVGCAFDCKFCASGLDGFARNLDAAEIAEQVIAVEELSGKKINNLVFMGMGEPLANLQNLLRSIEIINAEWGLGIGARRITVSTSGLAPQIEKLAQLPMQIRLAISLHGASDEVRSRIMPVNDRFPLDRLFEALHVWTSAKKQKITFEYILMDGVNDSLEQAGMLAKRARSIFAKVNLIPYNNVEGLKWSRPPRARQEAFLKRLQQDGVQATLRREKGHDINAACGQLRLKEEASAAQG